MAYNEMLQIRVIRQYIVTQQLLFCYFLSTSHTYIHTDLYGTMAGTMGRRHLQWFLEVHRASTHTNQRFCYTPALQGKANL